MDVAVNKPVKAFLKRKLLNVVRRTDFSTIEKWVIAKSGLMALWLYSLTNVGVHVIRFATGVNKHQSVYTYVCMLVYAC